jgi:5-formyltetrahydrofolate cyclo-ligase
MASPDHLSEKPALRRAARARRDAVPADVRHAAAHAAAVRVADHVLANLPAGAAIGLYASMRTELSTVPLAVAAASRGLVIAYPRTAADHTMVFHRVDVDDAPALAAGRFGIPEPSPDAEVIALEDLRVIVVPALLFDRDGYRLGWGGGWYDATLPRTTALRVGFALEQQIVDTLPRAAHDEPVHVIATEVGLLSPRHPGSRGGAGWMP